MSGRGGKSGKKGGGKRAAGTGGSRSVASQPPSANVPSEEDVRVRDMPIPAFLKKLWTMMERKEFADEGMIRWSDDGTSIIVDKVRCCSKSNNPTA